MRPEWNYDATKVLVKMMDAEKNAHLQPGDDGLLHGTVILKSLVLPWARTDRIVCADSYFATVGALQELERNGLRFIGVMMTAVTWQYPSPSYQIWR
jgi:homoaconitase/3-isopropylmalate dehydratase large subunit